MLAVLLGAASARSSALPPAPTWSTNFASPAIDGDVRCALRWHGGIVVGGRFSFAGELTARNLAFWDGSAWRDIGGTDGIVRCLALWNDTLVVGGDFAHAGTIAAPGVARWTGGRWLPMGDGLDSPSFGGTNALVVYRDTLVALGGFQSSGTTALGGAAWWDGAAWRRLGGGFGLGGPDIATVYHDRIVVAGGFTSADGQAANGLAAWDGARWSPMPWKPLAPSSSQTGISALAVAQDRLYAGGFFDHADTVAAHGLAAWDGSAWSAVPGAPTASVTAFATRGDTLIVVATWEGIRAWDGTQWGYRASNLGSAYANSLTIDDQGEILTGAVDARDPRTGDPVGFNVLVRSGGDWLPLQTWTPRMHGFAPGQQVAAIVRRGPDVLAAGAFSSVADGSRWIRAAGLMRWDGSAWQPFPGGPDVYGGALALAQYGDTIVVGGTFYSRLAMNYVLPGYRYDGSTWAPLDTLSLMVYALARFRGALYAAGEYPFGTTPQAGVYRLDDTHWTRVGTISDAPGAPRVFAMSVHDDRLVIGGQFSAIDGMPAANIAAWDGTAWSALGALVSANSNPTVYSLAEVDTTLYAGGCFAPSADGVARWDGSAWQTMGLGPTVVTAIAGFGGQLYAARNDWSSLIGDVDLVRWDEDRWTTVSLLQGTVSTLYADGNDLWAGGRISNAGGLSSAGVALWTTIGATSPTAIVLSPPAPNPSRGAVDFFYRLPVGGTVSLLAFDIGGRRVATLDAGARAAGPHSVHWDGSGDDGRGLPAGVYFVRLAGPAGLGAGRKVVLLP